MTLILGVDPGSTHSGWVEWDGVRVLVSGYSPNESIRAVDTQRYTACVCEMMNHQGMMPGAETFETLVWIGRFIEAWGQDNRVLRRDIKMHLCGNSRAKDSNIRAAIIERFGAPGTKKAPGATYGVTGHAWQALGAAITYLEARK